MVFIPKMTYLNLVYIPQYLWRNSLLSFKVPTNSNIRFETDSLGTPIFNRLCESGKTQISNKIFRYLINNIIVLLGKCILME